MITLQRHASYGGEVAKAPVTTVEVAVAFPVYAYSVGEGATAKGERADTGWVSTLRFSQPLSAATYQLTPGNAVVCGADGASAANAGLYYLAAARDGAWTDLVVDIGIVFGTAAGVTLGTQRLEGLCVPKIVSRSPLTMMADTSMSAASGAAAGVDYVLVTRSGFEAIRKQAASISDHVPDALLLGLVSVLTSFDGALPSIRAASASEIRTATEAAGSRLTATQVAKLAQQIKSASDALFDFKLLIPEIQTLKIAGTMTLVFDPTRDAAAADFQAFEITAECIDGASDVPRRAAFRFGSAVRIKGNAAAFSLADASPVIVNGLQDLVRIAVKGIDGATVWQRDFKVADPELAALNITVTAQSAATLQTVPATAEHGRSKRLRGQVLVFKKECVLKGAYVLIQARAEGEASPWRTVGAGTADAQGNFAVAYPYGRYGAARAIVSLSPGEYADIPVRSDRGDESIADDFLYLLLKEPQCVPPPDDKDCECGGACTDGGNRLPDHADLIGSDAYSQDIGGSCVNLSKPNRTISEYAYRAIVRTSDPEVANYTLTRHEAGLETLDVHLAAAIASGATGAGTAAASALANAKAILANTGTVFAGRYLAAMTRASEHIDALAAAVKDGAPPLTLTALAAMLNHIDAAIAVLEAYQAMAGANDEPLVDGGGARVVEAVKALRGHATLAMDAVGTAVRYELTGSAATRERKPVALNNPVQWQDAPEPLAVAESGSGVAGIHPTATSSMLARAHWPGKFGEAGPAPASQRPAGQVAARLAQAVSVATGHILHYKAVVKADGYSLGDLIYSLPLAPGQKKEIVVFDSSHALLGAETQALTQNERLAMGVVSERDIADQLAGHIAESIQGSSTADTRGISAGFGTAGQGYGGAGGAYGGSGSAVIGVAGGWAQASSQARQDSSRTVAQFFGEKLRQSILQNAEGYRQLNASVVTTVQEGQRYGVTAEVVANHNHCHALTMMYFEVLRHFAVFQELASVEECVFVPLLLTRFTTENIGKWRDVLAPALLPMPSDTYLQPHVALPNRGRQHPLLKAFDADQRLRTHYANVDFPAGAYDEERIQYIKGTVRLRVRLPRPRTRFDRILSFPVTKQFDAGAAAAAGAKYAQDMAAYSAKAALTGGLYTLFVAPPSPPNPEQFEVLAREAIADAFMRLDANYQTVPPAQCMRIIDFTPRPIPVMAGLFMAPAGTLTELDFFAENADDKQQWQLYADILGYPDVAALLNAHFKGNLIAEWDRIFQQDIAPLVFEKIIDAIRLDHFNTDFSCATKYTGGERLMLLDVMGTTAKSRNQLPVLWNMSVSDPNIQGLKNYVTLQVESASIGYATPHFNGTLYNGPIRNDLLDGVALAIPENSEDKRNPRKEDRFLAAKLIEHLNGNLEYYNKVLWYHLDPDRRFLLLDGFSIQVYDEAGVPLPAPAGLRSLASVVKNEVVAVVGNALVMPVAPGYRVSGSFIRAARADDANLPTLLDHYQPLTPVPPYRVSVPSKGVFAEAVQGACNACEKIETDRLQDWHRFPNVDEPASIGQVTVPTPAITDWRAAFKDFAAPIVNVQNAPAAPTPGAGLAGLSELLGKAGIFKDITGLDANQQNALKTLLSNNENAKAFADMAKEMAMQQHNTQNSGRIMDSIAAAKQSGDITQEQAGQLTKDHLQQQIDGGMTKKADLVQTRQAQTGALAKAAVDAAGQGRSVTAQTQDEDGARESVTIAGGPPSPAVLAEAKNVPGVAQPNANTCWAAVATMMCMWQAPELYQSIDDVMAAAGDKFVELYNQGRGLGQRLPTAYKAELLGRLRMTSEPSGTNYPLQSYIDWLKAYGPLWISIDADDDPDHYSAHAVLVTRITGTGAPDGRGTDVTYTDPMGAKTVTLPFSDFVTRFEGLAKVPNGTALSIQVVHFIDSASDGADGGGAKGGGLAGAGAAVGGAVLDQAADMAGSYVKTMMASGSGTLQLPSNQTLMLAGTKESDYRSGFPLAQSVRRCRITFADVAGTGPGDGLDGVLTLEWISTQYLGAIARGTPAEMVTFLRSVRFAKGLTGRGTLYVGGALESADVQVSLFSLGVEDKIAPPFMSVLANISVAIKAKSGSGDSVVGTLVLALNPDDPVNYRIRYLRTPHRELIAEVDPPA